MKKMSMIEKITQIYEQDVHENPTFKVPYSVLKYFSIFAFSA